MSKQLKYLCPNNLEVNTISDSLAQVQLKHQQNRNNYDIYLIKLNEFDSILAFDKWQVI